MLFFPPKESQPNPFPAEPYGFIFPRVNISAGLVGSPSPSQLPASARQTAARLGSARKITRVYLPYVLIYQFFTLPAAVEIIQFPERIPLTFEAFINGELVLATPLEPEAVITPPKPPFLLPPSSNVRLKWQGLIAFDFTNPIGISGSPILEVGGSGLLPTVKGKAEAGSIGSSYLELDLNAASIGPAESGLTNVVGSRAGFAYEDTPLREAEA